ncbi:COP1-interacting protein 7 [Solanum dulcamara]|uniref:COP1-interacting protein 7 n=1 Tax=Solanum dulcamara TaxID=45834 RepID=UPI0024866B5B|nr:COP1-interacting protein 7 [Solanum dulcamara]
MDSKTLLDYALFQLTPTRTRCDLVVFSGGKNEKLASGLVEPFISHLKFAKDQIPKGGYSITMRPPSTHAYWFTKATFQRFVRFVSTPEILERFMRLEREISQIESSIQSNECANSNSEEGSSPANSESTRKSNDSFKAKSEVEEANNAAPKENSKIHLQRHLDTRKALLRKEQAMAYARATVAGFEIDQLDDLIQFANSFGALRLRDACVDFKELYKQKHTDGQWMDEVAAMKACTPVDLSYLGNQGVILAYDNNGSLDSSDSKESTNSNGVKDENLPASDPSMSAKVQMQMPWQNQIPPYMYNFHGPAQQMPFAGMHPLQYYPAHMQWPQNVNGSTNGSVRDSHKRSKKKEKSKEHDSSEDDEQTESSASDSGTDSDEVRKHEKKHSSRENSHTKKHKRKSSKTVVIRNINYITSNKKNEENDGSSYDSSSAESHLLDEDSIKEQVDDAVAILEKRRNSKGHRNKNRGHQNLDVENESNGYSNTDLNEGMSPKLSEKAKGNKAWDAFQNILMSREDSSMNDESDHLPLNFQDEGYGIKNSGENVRRDHLTTDDSLLMSKNYEENDTKVSMVDFANGEDMRPSLKKGVSEDVRLLFSHKEPSGGNTLGTPSDFGSESSAIRKSNGEDWFVVNHSGSSEIQEAKRMIFDNDSGMLTQKSSSQVESERAAPIDDSFMVQSRPSFDDHYGSQWKTDIGMDADLVAAANAENGDAVSSKTKLSTSGASQPDDLCVVLARDSSLDPIEASWQPELDFQIEASFIQVDKKSSAVEAKTPPIEENVPVKGKSTTKDGLAKTGKDARSKISPGSLSRSRIDALAKSKKMSPPPNKLTTQKSKLDREEEMRKRMEELVIERQKRIAERSAAKGSSPAASKKGPSGSKTASSKISPSSKVHTFPVQVKH